MKQNSAVSGGMLLVALGAALLAVGPGTRADAQILPNASSAPTPGASAGPQSGPSGAPAPGTEAKPPAPGTEAVPPAPGTDAVPPAPGEAAPESGNALKTTFSNTLKGTLGVRLTPQNPLLSGAAASANGNDGDNSFNAGDFNSQRVDLLSELDFVGKHYGFRFSGEGWYDAVYNRKNAQTGSTFVNWTSVPYNNYPLSTVNVEGRGARLLDAFGYVSGRLGSIASSVRFGQFTQVWGESLFLGANSIAGGMSPVDVSKAVAVPDAQFKEIVLPVPQVAATLQFSPSFSLSAYDQLTWRKGVLPGVGSYFGGADVYDMGGERIFAGPAVGPQGPVVLPGGNPLFQYLERVTDLYPPNNKQYGAKLAFRTKDGYQLGAYFLAFNEKFGTPYTYVGLFNGNPAIGPVSNVQGTFAQNIGGYNFVYPTNVRVFGLSAAQSIGDFSVAGEVSYRANQDLNSVAVNASTVTGFIPPPGAPPGTPPAIPLFGAGTCFGLAPAALLPNNTTNPCYAIGSTLNLDANLLWTLPQNFISKEGSLIVEIGWLHLNGITQNPLAINPFATRNDSAFVLQYDPVFRKIRPGIDLDIPFTVSQGIQGVSPVAGSLNSGGVGTLNVAAVATVKNTVRYRFSYTHYLGPTRPFFSSVTGPAPVGTGAQVSGGNYIADRDWISISASRSF